MASAGATIAMVQRVSKVAMANQMRSRAVSVLLPSYAGQSAAAVLDVRSVGLVVHKKCSVPKEDLMQFEGLVTEILPDARYRVQLDNGHQLVAYTAGRMKRNRIKTLAGDRVTISITRRFGKGAIDLPSQGRTHRIAKPSAAASTIPAAVTANAWVTRLIMTKTSLTSRCEAMRLFTFKSEANPDPLLVRYRSLSDLSREPDYTNLKG